MRWRALTTRARMLPGFLIVGAQKCGTDSLCTYLYAHPQIAAGTHKEIFYFTGRYRNGLRWYQSHFPLSRTTKRAQPNKKLILTGEATPDYIFDPRAPERIAACLPNVKLIVLLRDPVARAYSHYHHSIKWKMERLSFAEAIEAEEERLRGEIENMLADGAYNNRHFRNHSYLARGVYADQLRRYYDVFDRNQILVIKSETFFQNTQAVFDRVTAFLELEPFVLEDKTPRNIGRYTDGLAETEPELAARLYAYFRPHNQALYRLLGEDMGWEANDPAGAADATLEEAGAMYLGRGRT
ncbi:MAG TPA: sulfotransferase domain-containing protein [Gammaproteobacteria bacterium]|nr:sulfotransferase domain-containing protein [Gammaproteobacteria bacterium]